MLSHLLGVAKSHSLRDTIASYSDLNYPIDHDTILLSDGSYRTVIEYHGTTALGGSHELDVQREMIYKLFKGAFSTGEHRWQIVFQNDPLSAAAEIEKRYAYLRANSERVGLDVSDLLDAQRDFLAGIVHSERCWWVITTYPGTLSKPLMKQIRKRRAKRLSEGFVPLEMAQNPVMGVKELCRHHQSLVRRLIEDLTRVGLHLQTLSVDEAIGVMGFAMDPSFTAPEFKVRKLGSDYKVGQFRAALEQGGDLSHLAPPPLSYQVSPTKAKILSDEASNRFVAQSPIKVGSRYYSSLSMHLGPENPTTFAYLLKSMINIPWRISFDVTGHGLKHLGLRGLVSKFTGFMRSNAEMSMTIRGIESKSLDGDPDLALNLTVTTWSDSLDQLEVNHNGIISNFESWGHTKMTDWVGDEVETWLSTVPGFCANRSGTTHALNLSDLLGILPLSRPTTPWRDAMAVLRSGDCKMVNYNTGTSEQKSYDDVIFASMGSGKSVWLNTLAFWIALAHSDDDLVQMLIVDIGWSSKGTIEQLRSRLPSHLRHKVQLVQLTNTEEHRINPFDLMLGLRQPITLQRDMLVYFLQVLITPGTNTQSAEVDEVDRNAGELAKTLVEEVYEHCAAPATAKSYAPNTEPLVDEALERLNLIAEGRVTWYEIGDELFAKGLQHEATLAYRHAVPVLSDVIKAMSSTRITDLFNNHESRAMVNQGSEALLVSAARGISIAMGEYKILSGPTRFDIGDVRILSVNLDLVAKGDARRASLMYLLTRDLLARKAYITEETVEKVLPQYKTWAEGLFERNRRQLKVFMYDEFHRTEGITQLRKLIKMDIREGRKWKIKTVLTSQRPEDFDEEMVELAANVFILGSDSNEQARALVDRFGLTDAAYTALIQNVTGPTSRGAPMLGVFKVKEGNGGKYAQVLYNSICPKLRWALTSVAEEANLRGLLEREIGHAEAVRVLSALFPGGAEDEISERKKQTSLHGGYGEDYLQSMLADILSLYRESLVQRLAA